MVRMRDSGVGLLNVRRTYGFSPKMEHALRESASLRGFCETCLSLTAHIYNCASVRPELLYQAKAGQGNSKALEHGPLRQGKQHCSKSTLRAYKLDTWNRDWPVTGTLRERVTAVSVYA